MDSDWQQYEQDQEQMFREDAIEYVCRELSQRDKPAFAEALRRELNQPPQRDTNTIPLPF